MAVDLQKLKRKMRGVSSTRQVTRALQMVSSIKMRKARDQAGQSRVYRQYLQELMETFETSPSEVFPELAVSDSGQAILVVVFASDRGLCGPYNTNILHAVATRAAEIGRDHLDLVVAGRKVGATLARRGYTLLSRGLRPDESESELFLRDLSRDLLQHWQSGRYRRVDLLYSSLEGMTVLKPAYRTWLPIASDGEGAGKTARAGGNYIDEPVPDEVLRQSVLRLLSNELLSAYLQSEASEQVARMVAMDNATRNADELFSSLQLTYNKARQAKITQEICEIVSGANAIG